MKRKKLLAVLIMLGMFMTLVAFTTSCELDGSSKSSDGYLQEEFVQISGHDNTPTGPIYYSSDGEFAINFNSSSITYQRESCSGFDSGTTENVTDGCYATIKFDSDAIDWATDPDNVSPSESIIYRTECITP